jgi:hypothetical protein
MYVQGNSEARSHNIVAMEKQKVYIFFCVCSCARACVRACVKYPGALVCAYAFLHLALLIQHATRVRHIVKSIVAPQAPPNFSTLSHKRRDFREKYYVFFFSTLVQNISHSKKISARYCHKCANVFM